MLSKQILKESINDLWNNFHHIKKAIAIPVIVAIIIQVIVAYELINDAYLLLWIDVYLSLVVVVSIHRILLLGERKAYFKLKRILLYFLYSFAIGLMIAPAALVAMVPYIGAPIAMIYGVVVFSCFSLMLPGIAIENEINFGTTWDIAKGNIATLVICITLVSVLISIPEIILSDVFQLHLLSSIMYWLTLPICVAILSNAFRILVLQDKGDIHAI